MAYPPHDLRNLTGPSSQRMAVCLVKDDEGQRPKPKRAPAAKKAAAQKKKHKIFKPRRTRRKVAAKRASKRKPNAQAARKAAAIASLPGSS